MAFVVPGFLIVLAQLVRALATRRVNAADDATRFGAACGVLFLLLWFYAYVVADFYLYQVIIVLPLFAIYAAYVFELCTAKAMRAVLCTLCLVTGFAPGVVMGLMGFKLTGSGEVAGTHYSNMEVTSLRNLFIDKRTYYKMRFGRDMDMFDHLGTLPAGTPILTHENRHLLLGERLPIIHLDDWEVQKAYHKAPAERVAILDKLGIRYYLLRPQRGQAPRQFVAGHGRTHRARLLHRGFPQPRVNDKHTRGARLPQHPARQQRAVQAHVQM